MAQVLDSQTQQPIDLPDAQVADAWRAGKVQLIPGTTFHVQMPTGQMFQVPAESLHTALGNQGTIVSAGEVAQKQAQRDYGGPNLDAYGMQPMMSDERAKTHIAPAPTADALLDTLARSKATFSYRNPADQPLSPAHPHVPGARFGGVMAQDLQRVPEIGQQLVTDTPRGKMLEPQSGLSAALMAIGRLHERLKAGGL